MVRFLSPLDLKDSSRYLNPINIGTCPRVLRADLDRSSEERDFLMHCPVCKTRQLTRVDLDEQLKAATCDGCGGHWLSYSDYDAWLKAHGETLPERFFSDVTFQLEDVQGAKICPECGRILLKYSGGHGLDFCLDHCGGCGGVWLDKNEWEALRARNLHDEIHKVFSTSWQAQVRGDRMRERLEAAYKSRFGAEAYQKVKDVRAWIQAQPQKNALLSFLADEDPFSI